jgi:hypothetical protein
MRFLIIDIVVQEESLYVYNMHEIVENHFCISIARVRSGGGSVVGNKNLWSLTFFDILYTILNYALV